MNIHKILETNKKSLNYFFEAFWLMQENRRDFVDCDEMSLKNY